MNRIDQVRPDAPPLAHPGAHAIGVRTDHFTRPNQPGLTTAQDLAPQDRTLTVETWYPASPDTTPGGTYDTILRDGVTPLRLFGRAARHAIPASGQFPLVLISHGYPGNRFLKSPLAETLATHGFVVAAIDHAASTYDDQRPLASTLYHRPRDQRFVLDRLAAPEAPLAAMTQASQTAVIGFSMGGYGALVFGGAGLAPGMSDHDLAPAGNLLTEHEENAPALARLVDERVKAIITFGPWGRHRGLWRAEGLAAMAKPLLLIAGSCDDTSDYSAMRQIWAESGGPRSHLMTFVNAGHNAGASMPAPVESYAYAPRLERAPFDHYGDPVWDTVRMNNLSAHMITEFLNRELRGDSAPLTLPDACFGVTLESR